jgi:serine phosphatase RsbU (regulator of sigma subunit)/pSer/pThr/pTyr-binding forkhead associated (FHA) protein
MSAVLQVSKGLTEGTIISLEGDKFVLGRNPDCGIVIPFNAVSREHAQILRIQGKYFIEDKQSRNGTFVNDKSITTRTQLKHNDKIRICDFLATFVEGHIPEEPENEADNSTVEATLTPSAHTLLETQPAEKLRGLLEIGSALSQTLDLDPLLPKIAESLFGLFRQADRCFLIQSEEPARAGDKPRLLPRLVKTRKASDEVNARFSSTIVRRCLNEANALLFDDAQRDERVQLSQSVVDFRIRSVMCVPLMRADGRAFGVIQLDTQDRSKKFKKEDLELLAGVAKLASIALENARLLQEAVYQAKLKRDLEVAHQVQMSFLPSELPTLPTYEFFAHYQPAQSVGGDYYGFIPTPDGRMVVTLGDVAGKGIPAALLMAKLSSEMRSCAVTEQIPASMVSKLNDLMYPFTNPMQRFVTLALMLLDPTEHSHVLVSAGHPSPLIYKPGTSTLVTALTNEDAGLPMGVLDGYPYQERPISLNKGEILVLFSDGLPDPEDMNDRPFGMDGVREAVKGLGATNAKTLVETILRAVEKHATGKPPFDDITIVAVRRTA